MKKILVIIVIITIVILAIVALFYRQKQTNVLYEIYKVEKGAFTLHAIFKTVPFKFKERYSIDVGDNELLRITDNQAEIKYHFGFLMTHTKNGFLYAPLYFRNKELGHINYREGINSIIDVNLFNIVINELELTKDTLKVKDLFLDYLVQSTDNCFIKEIHSNNDIQQLLIINKSKNFEKTYNSFEFSEYRNLYWINTFGIIELNLIGSKSNIYIQIIDHGMLGIEDLTI